MISLETARRLKAAGLVWDPKLHDFFAIPDRDLDEYIFVISDVQVTVEMVFGRQVVSFQGASEWALDSLIKDEAVWMPREDQLREVLLAALMASDHHEFEFKAGIDGYRVMFRYGDQIKVFRASNAGEAYADGICYVLDKQHPLGKKRSGGIG